MRDPCRDAMSANPTLLDQLEALGRDLAATRAELSSLTFDDMAAREIPHANAELFAIVAQTEGAADSILDGCEALDRLGALLADGERLSTQDAARSLFAATRRIYAACGFQDLTGQRVSKVVAALRAIEQRMAALTTALGARPRPPAMRVEPFGVVLHGPQPPGVAMTQADVDTLLRDVAS